MTALVGAVAIVSGAMLVIAKNDPTRWFKEWSGLVIPLMIVGVLWLLGVTVQYIFALANARKKKAKESARSSSDGGSGGRK
jgi:flagellar basal body-associated protein FliL